MRRWLRSTSREERLGEVRSVGWSNSTVSENVQGTGRPFFSPPSAPPRQGRYNVRPTTRDGEGRRTRRCWTMTGVPVWHRCSHAPGWGRNCSDGESSKNGGSVNRGNARLAPTFTCAGLGGRCSNRAPWRKGAPDAKEARLGPTIVMRRTWGVLQRQADGEGEGRRRTRCCRAMIRMSAFCRRYVCIGQGRFCNAATSGETR